MEVGNVIAIVGILTVLGLVFYKVVEYKKDKEEAKRIKRADEAETLRLKREADDLFRDAQ